MLYKRLKELYKQKGTTGVTLKALEKTFWYFYSSFASLEQLGNKYGTDKGNHTFKGVSYLDIYEQHFKPFKNKHINLLEIGVYGGSSLGLWKEYFPNAKIYGLDIDPRCKQYEKDRISIEIGSQADEHVLEKLCQKACEFDIIIDDGSHVNRHIIKSFKYLFRKLKPGGMYVIEDLGCSYEKLEEGNVREIWPGMKYNDPNENLNNSREDVNKFFEEIIYDLDHFQGEILTVQFWSNLCCIIKAKAQ